MECIFLGCLNTAFHMNKEEKNWNDEKKKKKKPPDVFTIGRWK